MSATTGYKTDLFMIVSFLVSLSDICSLRFGSCASAPLQAQTDRRTLSDSKGRVIAPGNADAGALFIILFRSKGNFNGGSIAARLLSDDLDLVFLSFLKEFLRNPDRRIVR